MSDRFWRARGNAVSVAFEFLEGTAYGWPAAAGDVPPVVRTYEASGLLECLDGAPAEYVRLRPEQFAPQATPRTPATAARWA